MPLFPKGSLVVYSTTSRRTGAEVEVIDGKHRDNIIDIEAGPWITRCVPHGTVKNHDKRMDAESFSSRPDEWCHDCLELVSTGERVDMKQFRKKEAAVRVVKETPPPMDIDPTEYDKMTPGQLERTGVCPNCYGMLKAGDGVYHTIAGPRSGAVARCCTCVGCKGAHAKGMVA